MLLPGQLKRCGKRWPNRGGNGGISLVHPRQRLAIVGFKLNKSFRDLLHDLRRGTIIISNCKDLGSSPGYWHMTYVCLNSALWATHGGNMSGWPVESEKAAYGFSRKRRDKKCRGGVVAN